MGDAIQLAAPLERALGASDMGDRRWMAEQLEGAGQSSIGRHCMVGPALMDEAACIPALGVMGVLARASKGAAGRTKLGDAGVLAGRRKVARGGNPIVVGCFDVAAAAVKGAWLALGIWVARALWPAKRKKWARGGIDLMEGVGTLAIRAPEVIAPPSCARARRGPCRRAPDRRSCRGPAASSAPLQGSQRAARTRRCRAGTS